MGTDKTRYRLWSEGKEFEHYSDIDDIEELLAVLDVSTRQGAEWVWVYHFGAKGLIRWSTVTRIELYDQDIPF